MRADHGRGIQTGGCADGCVTGMRRTCDHCCSRYGTCHVAGMYHMLEHYYNHSAVAIFDGEDEHAHLSRCVPRDAP